MRTLVAAFLCTFSFGALAAQKPLPTPRQLLGHDLGADYFLPNYGQYRRFLERLAALSDRLLLTRIGESEEGRPILLAVVSSPENLRRRERLRAIARRLALGQAEPAAAARLARAGRAVVWIDGGLHASEVLGPSQLLHTLYALLSRNDPETRLILDQVLVLFCNPNPDGQDLVARWYMREPDPLRRSTRHLPRLYQKYIGHDNNRDFYRVTQKETQAVLRVFFHEWFPQIVFNHHQTAPAGTVLFAPPFRPPHNPNVDPLVILETEQVGLAIHSRFLSLGLGGSIMRRGAPYSTWWNGGLRTVAYFHNMIGILTETYGHPTPRRLPFRPERHVPSPDLPLPLRPREWHFRDSLRYCLEANYAVLTYAARHREELLLNRYRLARRQIERGRRDHWTLTPKRVQAARKAAAAASGDKQEERFFAALYAPEARDPRAYVLPPEQPDLPTAVAFLRALQWNGITVHRAAGPLRAGRHTFPPGSFVVFTAQPFRAHILDMFEPQDYPNDRPYPGAPPRPPYDLAGYTLAFQMGVRFVRVLEELEGPCQPVAEFLSPPRGRIHGRGPAYLLDHRPNVAFRAVNELLREGAEVRWLLRPLRAGGRHWPAGTFLVRPGPAGRRRLVALTSLGLSFHAVDRLPSVPFRRLHPVRVALWDRYGGSMASGWLRWLLERAGVDFQVVYPPELDRGILDRRFHALILPRDARFARGPRRGGPKPEAIPPRYRRRLGRLTLKKTLPALRRFLAAGGTIVAIGGATSLYRHLGLPLRNHLVERRDGQERPIPRERFFIPGSLLRARVAPALPPCHGLPEEVDVVFRRSPVFRLAPEAVAAGVTPLLWFDTDCPLRSGWALGQHHLRDGIAGVRVPVGRGWLYLFGPEITFRAQPAATFKLLFNALLLAGAGPVQEEV